MYTCIKFDKHVKGHHTKEQISNFIQNSHLENFPFKILGFTYLNFFDPVSTGAAAEPLGYVLP